MADRYRITFEVTVEDEEQLRLYAQNQFREAWGSELTETGVEQLLLEAFLSPHGRNAEAHGISSIGFVQISPVFRRGG